MTMVGMIVGTPQYMSPEQITGQAVDARSDIFSVGAVAYELLTGRQAFGGDNLYNVSRQIVGEQPLPIESFVPDVPNALVKTIAKCLQKEPSSRAGNAKLLEREFLAIAKRLNPEHTLVVLPSEPTIVTPATPQARDVTVSRRELMRETEEAIEHGELTTASGLLHKLESGTSPSPDVQQLRQKLQARRLSLRLQEAMSRADEATETGSHRGRRSRDQRAGRPLAAPSCARAAAEGAAGAHRRAAGCSVDVAGTAGPAAGPAGRGRVAPGRGALAFTRCRRRSGSPGEAVRPARGRSGLPAWSPRRAGRSIRKTRPAHAGRSTPSPASTRHTGTSRGSRRARARLEPRTPATAHAPQTIPAARPVAAVPAAAAAGGGAATGRPDCAARTEAGCRTRKPRRAQARRISAAGGRDGPCRRLGPSGVTGASAQPKPVVPTVAKAVPRAAPPPAEKACSSASPRGSTRRRRCAPPPSPTPAMPRRHRRSGPRRCWRALRWSCCSSRERRCTTSSGARRRTRPPRRQERRVRTSAPRRHPVRHRSSPRPRRPLPLAPQRRRRRRLRPRRLRRRRPTGCPGGADAGRAAHRRVGGRPSIRQGRQVRPRHERDRSGQGCSRRLDA